MKWVIGIIVLISLALSIQASKDSNTAYCAVKGDEILEYWERFPGHGSMEEYLPSEKITLKWIKRCGSEDPAFTAEVKQAMQDSYKVLVTES